MVMNLPASAGDLGSISGSGRSPEEGNGGPLQYSAREISWTEEPGGPQSMGSQKSWTRLSDGTIEQIHASGSRRPSVMNGWAQLCSTCVLSPTLSVPPANSYRNLGSLKGCRMPWELEKEYSTRLRRMDCLKKLPMFVGFPFLTVSFSFSDRGQEIQRF